MTIYIDKIFFQNLIMNFLIIYITSKILKKEYKFVKYIVSAGIGATYSVITILLQYDIFNSTILKLILTIILAKISYNSNKKEIIRDIITLYGITYTLGGGILSFITNSNNIINRSLGIVFSIFVIYSIYKIYKQEINLNENTCTIILKIEEKYIKLKTFIDTGLNLKDEQNGAPVIVINKNVVCKEKLPKEKKRNIKYKTIDNTKETTGFEIEEVTIYHEGKTLTYIKPVIMISQNRIDNFDALIGINIIKEGKICGNNVAIKT